MKVYKLLLLVCLLFLLVSCSEDKYDDTYYFEYKGRRICVGDNCRDTVDMIGEDYSYREEQISCGSSERAGIFSYSCFEIQSCGDIIARLTLTNDSASTPEGVSVGTDRDRVTDIYGENFERAGESMIYRKGSVSLNFVILDGTVRSVYYEFSEN